MEHVLHQLELPGDQSARRHNVRQMPLDRRRATADEIDYLRVASVPLDKALLRRNRVLTGHEPEAARIAYRLLRTQVLQRCRENRWNTLAVTTPSRGAGSTLTAINLAISLAREIAYTVVLVDANLRSPGVLSCLGLPERPGLSEYLTDLIPVEPLMIRPYYLEDLVVLPGGQAVDNATELLDSPKMHRLVSDLKASADKCIIVFDLPPMLEGDETLAFAPCLDAALMVIEDGVTKRRDIARAMELLGVTNILGTVMNKAGGDAWR